MTILGPISVQSKVSSSISRVTSPHSDPEPPSICAAVMTTIPSGPSDTVISWHIATGGSGISTVTMAVHVLELPDPSVTVRTTILGPTSSQSKVSGVTSRNISIQLSVEPSLISPAVMITISPSRDTVISCALQTGEIVS